MVFFCRQRELSSEVIRQSLAESGELRGCSGARAEDRHFASLHLIPVHSGSTSCNPFRKASGFFQRPTSPHPEVSEGSKELQTRHGDLDFCDEQG